MQVAAGRTAPQPRCSSESSKRAMMQGKYQEHGNACERCTLRLVERRAFFSPNQRLVLCARRTVQEGILTKAGRPLAGSPAVLGLISRSLRNPRTMKLSGGKTDDSFYLEA